MRRWRRLFLHLEPLEVAGRGRARGERAAEGDEGGIGNLATLLRTRGGRGSDRNPGRSGGLWVEGSRGCSRTGRQ